MQIRRLYREVKLSYHTRKGEKPITIINSEDAKKIARQILKDCTNENFIVIALSTSLEVQGYTVLGKGAIDKTYFEMMQLFQFLMLTNCKKFIIAHNHLSSSAEPSEQDHRATRKVHDCAVLMECELLDHIIVSRNEEYSYQVSGELDAIKGYLPFE